MEMKCKMMTSFFFSFWISLDYEVPVIVWESGMNSQLDEKKTLKKSWKQLIGIKNVFDNSKQIYKLSLIIKKKDWKL